MCIVCPQFLLWGIIVESNQIKFVSHKYSIDILHKYNYIVMNGQPEKSRLI